MTDENHGEEPRGVPDPDLAGTTGLGTGGTGSVAGTDATAGTGYRLQQPEGDPADQPPPSMLTAQPTGTVGATAPREADDAVEDE